MCDAARAVASVNHEEAWLQGTSPVARGRIRRVPQREALRRRRARGGAGREAPAHESTEAALEWGVPHNTEVTSLIRLAHTSK